MSNISDKKIPIISSQAQQTQRAEIYLKDLKERFKQLRKQHDEVIQSSVDIINEIDDISLTFAMPSKQVLYNVELSNIKKLIMEFEMAKTNNATKSGTDVENSVNIKDILRNFEKLHETQLLKNSLVLLKQAKASFQEIETILIREKNILGTNVQNKIQIFSHNNTTNKPTRPLNSDTSEMNMGKASITSEETKVPATKLHDTSNSLDNGYEGDNDDSEYDLQHKENKQII